LPQKRRPHLGDDVATLRTTPMSWGWRFCLKDNVPPQGHRRRIEDDASASSMTVSSLEQRPRPRDNGLASRTLPLSQEQRHCLDNNDAASSMTNPTSRRRTRLKDAAVVSNTMTPSLKRWTWPRDDVPASRTPPCLKDKSPNLRTTPLHQARGPQPRDDDAASKSMPPTSE
jgi:hypothetical protein